MSENETQIQTNGNISKESGRNTKARKSAVLPIDLIQPRWEIMGPQERAYATCLLECVQLEHLMRKNLPQDDEVFTESLNENQSIEAESEDNDDKENSHAESNLIEKEVIPPSKYAMGRVAWRFSNYPEYLDLLIGMNIRYNFSKLVKFRNYLIHNVDSDKYTSSKLKKNYHMLSRMIYYLKRWPEVIALYNTINALIIDWYSQSNLWGPPPPVNLILRSVRKDQPMALLLGLNEANESTLKQALRMLVFPELIHTTKEIVEIRLLVSQIQTNYNQPTCD